MKIFTARAATPASSVLPGTGAPGAATGRTHRWDAGPTLLRRLQSAETLRPANTDVGIIKGDEKDPATCMRCKVQYAL